MLRRCQALLLSSKNLAAPTSSSPKSPSQLSLKDPWGPSKLEQDKAGGLSPSGWVFTPCPRCHHHQSPLNHRPGSMGRDKAKRAASIPSASHGLPNPTDSTKPGVEHGVMPWERPWGFFGAALMGLGFWGVPRERQSSQGEGKESQHLLTAPGRGWSSSGCSLWPFQGSAPPSLAKLQDNPG